MCKSGAGVVRNRKYVCASEVIRPCSTWHTNLHCSYTQPACNRHVLRAVVQRRRLIPEKPFYIII